MIRKIRIWLYLHHYHPGDLQQLRDQHCPNLTKQMPKVMTVLTLAACWLENTFVKSGYSDYSLPQVHDLQQKNKYMTECQVELYCKTNISSMNKNSSCL